VLKTANRAIVSPHKCGEGDFKVLDDL